MNGKIDMEEWVQGVVTMPIVMDCFCGDDRKGQAAVENAIMAADAKRDWKTELNSIGDKLLTGAGGALASGISSFKALWK